jgi:hypothetical protein
MQRIAYVLIALALVVMVACAIEGRIDVGTTPRSPCPQGEP